MSAKIVVEEGNQKGLSLSIEEGDSWVIGSDPSACQLVLEEAQISDIHILISRSPEGLVVENLAAEQPFLVNDEQLADSTYLLQNGDTIKIGGETLRFYEESSAQIHPPIEDDLGEESLEEESEIGDEIGEESDSKEIADNERENGVLEEADGNETEESNDQPREEVVEQEEEENEEADFTQEDDAPPQEELMPSEETPNKPQYITEETENLNNDTPANTEEVPLPIPEDNIEPQADHFNEEHSQDTIFNDDSDYSQILAEIDFGIVVTGRWLLKVVGGPNSGAEFYMQAGNSYLVGTDPQTCDIIFHDTSVSRQHAKITVTPEDTLIIEDLNSRNGILINGTLIQNSQDLTPSTIVTLGTTSFVVYDREGEMQTIISPLLPTIVKALQGEPKQGENPADPSDGTQPLPPEGERMEEGEHPHPHDQPPPSAAPNRGIGPYVVISVIVGLFAIAGIGTLTLFQDSPIKVQVQENGDELIQEILKPFPSIHWTFNKSNGSLLLLGHVLTNAEKNRLTYRLSDLKFIKSLDDSGIIIDEGVLSEVNSLLLNNPEWKGIRVFSPEAGQFILSGTLKNRRLADQLFNYISLNFPYLDGLKKQIIIEEDIVQQAQSWLTNADLTDITVDIKNGEIVIGGVYPGDKANVVSDLIDKIEQLPGVRVVKNQASPQTIESGIIDISDSYVVTGTSRVNKKYTVVINGKILSEGDDLDGMTIDKISPNSIQLHRGNDRFRISY